MTVVADPNVFPNNIVQKIISRVPSIDSDLFVIARPLRNSDPPQSVGVVSSLWTPDTQSLEMKGAPLGQQQPTISRYITVVQAFVKNMNQEAGISEHATLSNMLRRMLYSDSTLRVQLGSLVWTDGVKSERAQRWGILNQRFVSNEISGEWLYLSNLEFWLETETD